MNALIESYLDDYLNELPSVSDQHSEAKPSSHHFCEEHDQEDQQSNEDISLEKKSNNYFFDATGSKDNNFLDRRSQSKHEPAFESCSTSTTNSKTESCSVSELRSTNDSAENIDDVISINSKQNSSTAENKDDEEFPDPNENLDNTRGLPRLVSFNNKKKWKSTPSLLKNEDESYCVEMSTVPWKSLSFLEDVDEENNFKTKLTEEIDDVMSHNNQEEDPDLNEDSEIIRGLPRTISFSSENFGQKNWQSSPSLLKHEVESICDEVLNIPWKSSPFLQTGNDKNVIVKDKGNRRSETDNLISEESSHNNQDLHIRRKHDLEVDTTSFIGRRSTITNGSEDDDSDVPTVAGSKVVKKRSNVSRRLSLQYTNQSRIHTSKRQSLHFENKSKFVLHSVAENDIDETKGKQSMMQKISSMPEITHNVLPTMIKRCETSSDLISEKMCKSSIENSSIDNENDDEKLVDVGHHYSKNSAANKVPWISSSNLMSSKNERRHTNSNASQCIDDLERGRMVEEETPLITESASEVSHIKKKYQKYKHCTIILSIALIIVGSMAIYLSITDFKSALFFNKETNETAVRMTTLEQELWGEIDKITKIKSGDQSGHSVSISADGRILTIGARYYSNNRLFERPGNVRIFKSRLSGDNVKWQKVGSFVGENNDDQFGYSLSISNDGKRLAIGAPGSSKDSRKRKEGCVYIYEETRDGLWIEVHKSYGKSPYELFGLSVSLAGDTLAIGAPHYKDLRGTVYILRRNVSKIWETSQIFGDSDPKDNFGWSISLSQHGTQLAVGAPSFHTSTGGYVLLYRYLEIVSQWSLMPLKLSRNYHGDDFGNAVSQSSDGSRLLIGSPGYDSSKGLVCVYSIAKDSSSMITKDLVGSNESNAFGHSVQLSIDGSHFAIGSPGKGRSGSAKICKFYYLGRYHCNELFGKERDNFGYSISLNKNGSSVVIGAPFSGSTLVFSKR